MNRRELLRQTAAFSLWATAPLPVAFKEPVSAESVDNRLELPSRLPAPANGAIPVAFLISQGAVVIDFCGPWEVFQDVWIPGRRAHPFHLYTVAETLRPIIVSGGMKVTPNYTLHMAPPPKVIVIPAQEDGSQAMLEWIRKSAQNADLILSVCTGAFLLARSGLLAGKTATTHHDSYRAFARLFPDVRLKRGVRFVEDGKIATAGGLASGIDLALRVTARYFGRDVARQTAYHMEYQGQGWLNADSNSIYASVGTEPDDSPFCPVCGMDVDPKTAPSSVYEGVTYYFCMLAHKQKFDATPKKFVKDKAQRSSVISR